MTKRLSVLFMTGLLSTSPALSSQEEPGSSCCLFGGSFSCWKTLAKNISAIKSRKKTSDSAESVIDPQSTGAESAKASPTSCSDSVSDSLSLCEEDAIDPDSICVISAKDSQNICILKSGPLRNDDPMWHENFEVLFHRDSGRIYMKNLVTGHTSLFEEDRYYYNRLQGANGTISIRGDLSIEEKTGVVTDKQGVRYTEVIGIFTPVDL